MTKGTDLTAHKRFSYGGGSYIYRGHNIEKIDGRWVFALGAFRKRTSTLKDARALINDYIEYREYQDGKAGA